MAVVVGLPERRHQAGPERPESDGTREASRMAGSVARVTEISAKSDTSFEDAIKTGIERATSTLRGVTSAWVKEQEVEISNGQVQAYKVNMLITFVLD
jgi:flavin-binding protein dodecin